jgi:transposase
LEEDVIAWLRRFPQIQVISRDGSPTYAKAIAVALPNAVQISDRFHLLRNLTDRAMEAIHQRMPCVVKREESPNTGLETPSVTMKRTSDARKNKLDLMERIRIRYQECHNLSKVGREFKINYRTVQKYIGEEWSPSTERDRYHPLIPMRPIIEQALNDGMKLTALLRILQNDHGYKGSYSSLKVFLGSGGTKKRFGPPETVHRSQVDRLLFDRGISDLMLTNLERKALIAYLKEHPDIQDILNIVTEFRIVVGSTTKAKLDRWLLQPRLDHYKSLKKFKESVYRDYDAVMMGIIRKESNGIAEGKVNKIKNIKRQMYGRCSFELLRKKVLNNEYST